VVTILNPNKRADRSHFERFAAYHESFYRSVEATSVTPFRLVLLIARWRRRPWHWRGMATSR